MDHNLLEEDDEENKEAIPRKTIINYLGGSISTEDNDTLKLRADSDQVDPDVNPPEKEPEAPQSEHDPEDPLLDEEPLWLVNTRRRLRAILKKVTSLLPFA